MTQSLRTTIIGGIVFLVPVIFILMIIGRAFEIALKIATPLGKILPVDTLAGVALVNLVAALMVAVICYMAGLAARSSLIADKIERLDAFLGRAIPIYHPTKKGFVDSVHNRALEDTWHPVLAGHKGEARYVGFEVERLGSGEVVVFQPTSPNTNSGIVLTVPAELVEPLEVAPRDLSTALRNHGIGLSDQLTEKT